MRISKSKVVIMIPSAAGETVLDRCLKTIYGHTLVEYVIIVVSQGELGAHEYLKNLEHKGIFDNGKKSKNLFVHYNDYNEPGSRGYNRGIKLAYKKVPDFDYMLFMDDDMIVLQQGWLNNLALHLDDHNDVGIVGYKMCCLGKENEYGSVQEMMSCCMLCRKDMMDQIGSMDENLLWHRNDSDYCLRSWQAGYRVQIIHANDTRDVSNTYLYHKHQAGTKRMKDDEMLREETYRRYDKKWKGVEINIW